MIILYPSYSFETLSSDRTEDEAVELLAAWSAAFHPALLEKIGELPRWESASVPPYEAFNPITKQPTVCIIPPSCESYLDENWFEHQQQGGAVHFRQLADRNNLAAALLEHYEVTQHGFDDDFVADCYALATLYFLTDILVRKLHYANLIDDVHITSKIFEAVKSYRQDKRDEAADHLRQAFEAVCTSKEYYYPAETYFLDLTLLTAKTFAATFRQLTETRKQINLFLPAKLLTVLSQESPELLAVLKTALAAGNIQIIADAGIHPAALPEQVNISLLLLPLLHIAERITGSQNVYQEQIGITPAVFGCQMRCLNPLLPQLLKLANYKGAVHFAPRDGWKISDNGNSKMIWQGTDGTKIDALVRYPLNGSAGTDFFALAEQLGNTINSDQCPTAVFAEFPGVSKTQWLDDLRRVNAYASALGRFTSIEQYFDDTPQCGGVRSPGFEEYPETFLTDENESNPVSQWNERYQENIQRTLRTALKTMQTLLTGKDDGIDDREETVKVLLTSFASSLFPSAKPATLESPVEPPPLASPVSSLLVCNPFSFPRKVYLDVSDWQTLPPTSETVELAKETDNDGNSKKEILVNVPPMGYSFVKETGMRDEGSGIMDEGRGARGEGREAKDEGKGFTLRGLLSSFSGQSERTKSESEPPMIRKQMDDAGKDTKRPVFVLENEFFEAKIDAVTGMLRSLFTPNIRFNRLSQQLGFRFPKAVRREDFRNENDPNRGYAVSAADEITMEHGALSSKLHIKGRLAGMNGETAAAFEQTLTIRRRSRILETELTLHEPEIMPSETAWDSYYALRSAWNDSTLTLGGGLGDGLYKIDDYSKIGSKVYAPRFVDLRGAEGLQSLTLFSEGFPFHRRFGERQLDTILVTKNEGIRRFRFGIGVDIRNPVAASLEFFVPDGELVISVAKNPRNVSAWFFQIAAKNVIALKWEAMQEEGRAVGFRVFLLETEGRRTHFAFSSFLLPRRAAAADFSGRELKELKTEGDDVLIDMHRHELLVLNVWL